MSIPRTLFQAISQIGGGGGSDWVKDTVFRAVRAISKAIIGLPDELAEIAPDILLTVVFQSNGPLRTINPYITGNTSKVTRVATPLFMAVVQTDRGTLWYSAINSVGTLYRQTTGFELIGQTVTTANFADTLKELIDSCEGVIRAIGMSAAANDVNSVRLAIPEDTIAEALEPYNIPSGAGLTGGDKTKYDAALAHITSILETAYGLREVDRMLAKVGDEKDVGLKLPILLEEWTTLPSSGDRGYSGPQATGYDEVAEAHNELVQQYNGNIQTYNDAATRYNGEIDRAIAYNAEIAECKEQVQQARERIGALYYTIATYVYDANLRTPFERANTMFDSQK
ncbi:MAG: hypothetical protein LBJ69_01955 [Holosporales bacterium]|nr:hypothetical protein [Holosporales bacterium]